MKLVQKKQINTTTIKFFVCFLLYLQHIQRHQAKKTRFNLQFPFY